MKANVTNMSISIYCLNGSTMAPVFANGTDTSSNFTVSYYDANGSASVNLISLNSGGAAETVNVLLARFNTSATQVNFTITFVNETVALEVGGGARCNVNVTFPIIGLGENHTAKYDFNTLLNYNARAGDLANISKSAVIGKYIRDPGIYAAPVDDSEP